MRINKPWYLTVTSIRGFEDPVTPPAGEVTPPAGEVVPPVEEVKPAEEDTAGLKSALQKERADRKAMEKKLQAFEKAQQEKADAEKTEIERLTDQGSRSTAKLQKLAEGFRTTKVEAAIIKAASDAKFTDPTDALRKEVLDAIGVEQDEDDPTQVTVDEATVLAAIKKLAKDKPHYLGATKKVLPPSGSKFGGNQAPQQQTQEQALRAQYPALARRG